MLHRFQPVAMSLLILTPPSQCSDAQSTSKEVEIGSVFELEISWPLCGRIIENSPPAWTPADGCPVERADSAKYTDFPLHSTYGPRLLNGKYDFHRGLDIATPIGTPVFAVVAGTVAKVKVPPGLSQVETRSSRST